MEQCQVRGEKNIVSTHLNGFLMKIFTIYLVIILILLIGCSSETVNSEKKTWQIQIPLNEASVHANATYFEQNGEITLEKLVISSLLFNEQIEVGDTTYCNGTIKQYIPPAFENSGSETGNVKISLTDDWVFLESISDNISESFFSKQAIDTTGKATINFQHFPVYPRLIEENNSTEIVREENSGNGWQLNSVYRKFQIGKEMSWDDQYGRQEGVFVKTLQHSFNADSIYFNAMFDESGIVVSQSSLTFIFIDNINPENSDTVYFHQLNRRLKKYSNPLLVPDLKTFADQIINTPLIFFINN